MRVREDSLGFEKTPKMVRKKNGTLFCYSIPCSTKSIILGVCLSMPFFIMFINYINSIPILSESTFIMISLSMGITFLLFCYFNYSGMYITKRKSVFYQNYWITLKVNMSKVEGIFIIDASTYRRARGYIYYQDEDTKERMSMIIVVRKINKYMTSKYYHSEEFERRFPNLVMAKCMYDEDFLAELLKINPKIRVINKTMRELKTPTAE
ncbi:MAG: hypothetical protein SOT59_01420 [Eubacteriales bacterium]|nr:hypothetical protein [Eubacteriales bacterium]